MFLGLAFLWASIALLFQGFAARKGRRDAFAEKAGSPWAGVVYAFTGAMRPDRKESAARHPVVFGAGVVLHAAVAANLVGTALVAVTPPIAQLARPLWQGTALAGLASGALLVVRRAAIRDLRAISVPDDFVASAAVAALLAASAAHHSGLVGAAVLESVAALFLLYVPLGKLRHALFFFLARYDLGRRLGRRGVYPPPAGV